MQSQKFIIVDISDHRHVVLSLLGPTCRSTLLVKLEETHLLVLKGSLAFDFVLLQGTPASFYIHCNGLDYSG